MNLEILSEDVKEFCRRASSKQELGMSFIQANTEVLNEVLPNYEAFWQLVILAVICRRGDFSGDIFMDYFLDHTDQKIHKFVWQELAINRQNGLGIGKMHLSHKEWNEEVKELMDIMAQKDKRTATTWPLTSEA
jgi:hypothetical protein